MNPTDHNDADASAKRAQYAREMRGIISADEPTPAAPDHAAMVAELRAARERVADLEQRLREATNLDERDAQVMMANRRIAALEAREAALVAAVDEACDGWRSLIASDHGEEHMPAAIVEIERIRSTAHPERTTTP